MSAPPPVSVLLPVRDGAAHLDEAAASLEAQTDGDFEVLAVDDGSTDATPELLRAWAERDRRVRVLRQEASGIVAALERARREARGRYLARMDADDVSEPERFALQRALLEETPALAGCGARVRYFPRHGLRDGARRYEAWLNGAATPAEVARELFVECPLAHPSFFLRADCVEAVGGYVDPGWPEDYDLLLRLWGAGWGLANVPRVLLHWREGERRLSRTHGAYAPEAFVACKVHHLRATLLRDRRPAAVWGAGPVGKAFARALLAAGTPVAAFVEVDPRKIGQAIHGAPVLDTPAGLALQGVLHLAAVGQPGGRATLREVLHRGGLEELRDYVAVA
ncbi:MAG TPA: glycosyltransferase [Longimicrobiales bacterium]|nr:glycosyltransferase [Longimicrobiales bacterium]